MFIRFRIKFYGQSVSSDDIITLESEKCLNVNYLLPHKIFRAKLLIHLSDKFVFETSLLEYQNFVILLSNT